jgi:hypothetical protein
MKKGEAFCHQSPGLVRAVKQALRAVAGEIPRNAIEASTVSIDLSESRVRDTRVMRA